MIRVTVVVGLVMVVAAGTPAHGQEEQVDYVVRAGDTCAAIARRMYGSAERYDLIHRANPQLGAPPHKLVPGSVLKLPRTGLRQEAGPDARITAMNRRVQSRAPTEANWHGARRGEELYRAWRVNTLDHASAEITFADQSAIQMRANTLVIIYGGTPGQIRKTTTTATIERGTLRSRLGELAGQERRLDVATPSSSAQLHGGSAVISVDPQGTSRLSNHDGRDATLVGAKGRAVRVRRGMGTLVATGAVPAPPRPLPPAPAWVASGERSFAGIERHGATIRGAWSPVAQAARYHVEVVRAGNAGGLVAQLDVPATVTQFEVHRLPAGAYQVTVATIDAAGLESAPSTALTLTAVMLRVQGATGAVPVMNPPVDPGVPSPARVLVGTRLVPPAGMRCAAGNDEPAAVLRVREPGVVSLRCIDDDGNAVGGLALEVVAVTVDIDTPGPLVRGATRVLSISVQSNFVLPDQLRFTGRDLFVVSVEQGADQHFRIGLAPKPDAPSEVELVVQAELEDGGTMVLARTTLAVAEQAVAAPPPTATAMRADTHRAWLEPAGLTVSPRLLGLRDDRREGWRAWLALADRGDSSAGRVWSTSVGVAGEVLRGRLRVRVAAASDMDDLGLPAAFFAGVTWRAHATSRVHASAELAAWQPLGSEPGRPGTTLLPSIEASVLLDARTLVRTRQGMVLDPGAEGAALWSSSYGVDVWLYGPLSIGGEIDLALGDDAGELAFGRGMALALGLSHGRLTAALAARLDSRDQDSVRLWGRGIVNASLGVRF